MRRVFEGPLCAAPGAGRHRGGDQRGHPFLLRRGSGGEGGGPGLPAGAEGQRRALYLATATDREVITKGLERTGILPLLDGLVTCGDLGVDKRTPEIFDYARDRMGTKTESTWVFEDAVHAAATAAAAGYPVAGVADPYSDQAELRKLSRIYLPDMTDFSGFYQRATR